MLDPVEKHYAYEDHLDSDKRKLEAMIALVSMQWFGYRYDYDSKCYVIEIPTNVVDDYKVVSS